MSAYLPAAFKLKLKNVTPLLPVCLHGDEDWFSCLSEARKCRFSIGQEAGEERECSVSSAAKPYLPKTTEGRSSSLIKVLTPARPGHLV